MWEQQRSKSGTAGERCHSARIQLLNDNLNTSSLHLQYWLAAQPIVICQCLRNGPVMLFEVKRSRCRLMLIKSSAFGNAKTSEMCALCSWPQASLYISTPSFTPTRQPSCPLSFLPPHPAPPSTRQSPRPAEWVGVAALVLV
jgi:hypothetical protein